MAQKKIGDLTAADVGDGGVLVLKTDGKVPAADLGTGTADATTFLRGDRTWVVPAAGGGAVLASIIDAAGDLIVGTADNMVGRLARGGALQTLRVNAGETALEWASLAAGATTVASYAKTAAQRAVVGNSLAKPVSGFYATLALAQADYPHVSALTDELDWAVLQAAIDAVSVAEDGDLFLPPGLWRCNRTVALKTYVHLRGAGMRESYIYFPVSLGTNIPGVDASVALRQSFAPTLSHLAVSGPGGLAYGNPGTNLMWGVKTNGYNRLNEVLVNNFWAGVAFGADHEVLFQCHISGNYHNILFPDGALVQGNQLFSQCTLSGAFFSSVCVQGNNVMGGVTFDGGHTGFAPYAFYKYDSSGANTHNFMQMCHFNNLMMEGCGNGAILDESTGAASTSMTGCILNNSAFSWHTSAATRIAARPRDYAVNVRTVYNTKIFNTVYPFLSGDIGAYNIVSSDGLIINEATPPVITGSAFGIVLILGSIEASYFIAVAAITSGNLVEQAAASSVREYGFQSRAFVGVALASAVANAWVPIARRGRVSVNCGAEAIASTGVPLVPSPANLAKVAPVSSVGNFGYILGGTGVPGKHPVIAYSTNTVAANGVALVWLDAPRTDRLFVAPGAVTTLPTAGAAYRGQILRVEGGTGVADLTYLCKKDAADVYAWVAF